MAASATGPWPRVIKRGPLKGKSFGSQWEYMKALNDMKHAPGSKDGKAVPGTDYYYELTLVKGPLRLTVTGDPRKEEDIDTLLGVLGQFGTE